MNYELSEFQIEMKHYGITQPKIEEYMYSFVPPREGVLADMEAHAEREEVPIIGPMAGHLIYTLAVALT